MTGVLWSERRRVGRGSGGLARAAMLSLSDIFLAGLLVVNGMAVLNEERFLVKIGWGYEASRTEPASVKKQIISLLHAVRLLFTLPLSAQQRTSNWPFLRRSHTLTHILSPSQWG